MNGAAGRDPVGHECHCRHQRYCTDVCQGVARAHAVKDPAEEFSGPQCNRQNQVEKLVKSVDEKDYGLSSSM
jgi:hypothetical protein